MSSGTVSFVAPHDELSPKLASSRDVVRYFTKLIGHDRVESMIVVGVNARLHVTFHRVVGRGGLTSCGARIADVLRPLVMNASYGAMLVHNHPSGDPTERGGRRAHQARV